jgi:hypothetical protein
MFSRASFLTLFLTCVIYFCTLKKFHCWFLVENPNTRYKLQSWAGLFAQGILGSWGKYSRVSFLKTLGRGGDHRPVALEDLDVFKISLWVDQWLAQSCYSRNICWTHEQAKGRKTIAGEMRNFLLCNSARWLSYWLVISYRIDHESFTRYDFTIWFLLVCPARPRPTSLHPLYLDLQCCLAVFMRVFLILPMQRFSGLPLK